MSPEEVTREVRRLEITTRHLVRDIMAGEYSSAFRGRGVEFAEVREYQPGDDVRTIDWNVTARLGSAYVKRYLEERELTVLFVADQSASARFGSVRRLFEAYDYAAERDMLLYGGGQFELGPGRDHIQHLASLFHPDGPNDVAPREYNAGGPRPGLPTSPLPARAHPAGLGWG